MNSFVAWCSAALVSVALVSSCGSSRTSNEDGDDDTGGRSPFGGAAGIGGASGGSGNRDRGGTSSGGSDGGESGTAGDTGEGGTTAGTSGNGGDGGAGDAGETGTGGGGATGGNAGSGVSGGGGGGIGGSAGGGQGGSGGCVGLECQVIDDSCPTSSPTTLSGTVFAPNGTLPIYNVRVYVPRAPLSPIADGVSCATCSSPLSGIPVTVALSDTSGRFRLPGVPSGTNVPFVMELGKWRRVVTIPTVTKCVDNPVTNAELTRLPRNSTEGHIPRIAITTGGSEALECLPRRLGIADTEFATDGGAGRVHLYAGGNGTLSFYNPPASFAPATALWSDRTKLFGYDAVLMSCEGSTSQFAGQKPPASIDNLAAYANAGGRIFFSHLHLYWLQRMAGFSATASYVGNLSPPPNGVIASVNQNFPKGLAFAEWMNAPAVAATTALGQLALTQSEHSVTSVNAPTAEWVSIAPNPANGERSSQALSFNTPLAEAEGARCGRSTFADIHFKPVVGGGGGDDSDPAKPFPSGCSSNPMSSQMKAFAFLFFDLTGCVQPDGLAPSVP